MALQARAAARPGEAADTEEDTQRPFRRYVPQHDDLKLLEAGRAKTQQDERHQPPDYHVQNDASTRLPILDKASDTTGSQRSKRPPPTHDRVLAPHRLESLWNGQGEQLRKVGLLLRDWRGRRRLTQLELAPDSGVSTRHLSFVGTGRSRSGRETLAAVAEQLHIPFRERKPAPTRRWRRSGISRAFPRRSRARAVHKALDRILAAHERYPAVIFDRAWNLVATNPRRSRLTLRCSSRRSTSRGPACIRRRQKLRQRRDEPRKVRIRKNARVIAFDDD